MYVRLKCVQAADSWPPGASQMSEVNFTFRVDQALKDAFVSAAKQRNRNGSQLLRDYMLQYIDEAAATAADARQRGQETPAIKQHKQAGR
uniref:YacA-like protein n=1 Tax=Rhizobium meliloti TaxID=382 RepID=Q5BTP2_RHIML|nr:YacA-like protein [Sinorhizobium meliloti]